MLFSSVTDHEVLRRCCLGRPVPDRICILSDHHHKHLPQQPEQLHQQQPSPGAVLRRSLYCRQQPGTQPQRCHHSPTPTIHPHGPSHGNDATHHCQEAPLLRCGWYEVSCHKNITFLLINYTNKLRQLWISKQFQPFCTAVCVWLFIKHFFNFIFLSIF